MTSAVVVNEVQAVASNALLAQDILLSRIEESRTNPRREFDETKLSELSSNIRQHGVLQPVLVRPLPGGELGCYELVGPGGGELGCYELVGPGRGGSVLRVLRDENRFPPQSANSPMPSAWSCNSSKTCNAPTCTI